MGVAALGLSVYFYLSSKAAAALAVAAAEKAAAAEAAAEAHPLGAAMSPASPPLTRGAALMRQVASDPHSPLGMPYSMP